MKLTCLKENLIKGLSTVSRTVGTKSTLPSLSHIYLKADKGSIKLAATNLEIGVNYFITGKVEETGQITVPARLLTEFVSSLPNGKVEITSKGTNLTAVSAQAEANINGGDPGEFPLIPEISGPASLTLKNSDLIEAIRLVAIAAAHDETRPVLTGVLFKVEGDKCTLAATDSYRLGEKVIKLSKAATTNLSLIVPVRALEELGRILAEIDDDIEVFVTESQIAFKVGDSVELVSRLIDGQFPNYTQIIPDAHETKATLDTAEFTAGLKAAYLFARESANSVKLEFKSKDGLTLSASAGQVGDTKLTVAAKLEGQDGEISLNAKYLLDALTNLKSSSIVMELNGKLNPALVRPIGAESDYLYIVMPLRS